MNKMRYLVLGAVLCPLLGVCPRAESGDVLNAEEDAIVKLLLTKLVADDQNFEIGWKIINDADHDVWICDSSTDWFMASDNETLVIRMRYNISNEGIIWELPSPRFRYSRLRPGEQKVNSIVLATPVEESALFKASAGNAEEAKRLALEIGYYNEDLRALILDIVDVAERLNCDVISPLESERTSELHRRFFGGLQIARSFNFQPYTYFRDSVTSGGDEIIAPYFRQALHGEQVLRLEVDNVSIPYMTHYPPLLSHEAKSTKPQQGQDANRSGKTKPAREKG